MPSSRGSRVRRLSGRCCRAEVTPGPHVRRLRHIVMVDTGACYGGDLSAYCPETEAVIAVPGLRSELASSTPGFIAAAPQPAAARS